VTSADVLKGNYEKGKEQLPIFHIGMIIIPGCGTLMCKEWLMFPGLISHKKGSLRSSPADNLCDTFAIHFSINALTSGSVTLAKDAGLIPWIGNRTMKVY